MWGDIEMLAQCFLPGPTSAQPTAGRSSCRRSIRAEAAQALLPRLSSCGCQLRNRSNPASPWIFANELPSWRRPRLHPRAGSSRGDAQRCCNTVGASKLALFVQGESGPATAQALANAPSVAHPPPAPTGFERALTANVAMACLPSMSQRFRSG